MEIKCRGLVGDCLLKVLKSKREISVPKQNIKVASQDTHTRKHRERFESRKKNVIYFTMVHTVKKRRKQNRQYKKKQKEDKRKNTEDFHTLRHT